MDRPKPWSLFFLVMLLCLSLTSHASYRKNLWPLWQINDSLSTKVISHQKWQQFLSKVVRVDREEIHLINYQSMSKDNKERLNQYIWDMSQIKINQYSRPEQLAFWLNLYNALVVKLIIDHYPVSSIQDINISPGLFSIGPWSANLIRVNNTALSLDDINNRIIRPIWNDVRTHYALNNATIGAANLPVTPFEGKLIEQQLNKAATAYINSLRGMQLVDNKLIVSKIYDWFEEDFGGSKQDVIAHLRLYASPEKDKKLKKAKTITSYMYNWHLNGVN